MDLSNINILALTSEDTTAKRIASTEGGNYEAKCPVCGDRDDFIILPEHTTVNGLRRGQCFCRECHPARMDAIEYLQWARRMDYTEAVRYLHDQYNLEIPDRPFGFSVKKAAPAPQYRVKAIPENALAPAETWQVRGKLTVERAVDWLWDEQIGRPARDYLHSRGLTDETIKTEGLGFIPQDAYDNNPQAWGLDPDVVEIVYIPCGIIFPYWHRGELWKIRVRRFGDDIPADKRYYQVPGSSNGLYRADKISIGGSVAMFEGELNAISCAQEVGDELVACVAIGSNTHARTPKWLVLLRCAICVLLCFDPDTAGDDARDYWSTRLGNAHVWSVPPGCKDTNDMLCAGDDILEWLLDDPNWTDSPIDSCAALPPAVEPEPEQKPKPLGGEQFMEIVQQIGDQVGEETQQEWTISVLPKGWTLADYVDYLHPKEEKPKPKTIWERIEYLHPNAPATESTNWEEDKVKWAAIRERCAYTPPPQWLVAGTYEWNKQVERSSVREMMARRQAWFDQQRLNDVVQATGV